MSLIDIPSTTAYPLAGLLGGVGVALSTSLLLYASGRTFGVSGFLHRSAFPQSSSSDGATRFRNRIGDVSVVAGLGLGGWFIGLSGSGSAASLYRPTVWTAVAGLLAGMGSRLQAGCTSGHMICGMARFSKRSIIASCIFILSGSLVVQLDTASLPVVSHSDWVLSVQNQSLTKSIIYLLFGGGALLQISRIPRLRNNAKAVSAIHAGIHLITGAAFGVSLGLGGVASAVRVRGFLVTPFFQPDLFDPTLVYFALGALPLAALGYHLGSKLRDDSRYDDKTIPTTHDQVIGDEREPILPQTSPKSYSIPYLVPTDVWPSKAGDIDRRLIFGAVLFGIGWGLTGVCPGPAVVNLGTSLHAVSLSGHLVDASYWTVWLLTFVVGGRVVPQ